MNEIMSLSPESLKAARELLADALEMEPSEIMEDAAIGQLHNWDSLAHMRLMLALENKIGAPLSPDEIVSIGSLQDIATVLQNPG